MHETLEMKEDEVAQLRSRLQQVTALKEEIQEQKEKAEKSGRWDTAEKHPSECGDTCNLCFSQHLRSSRGH